MCYKIFTQSMYMGQAIITSFAIKQVSKSSDYSLQSKLLQSNRENVGYCDSAVILNWGCDL